MVIVLDLWQRGLSLYYLDRYRDGFCVWQILIVDLFFSSKIFE